MTKTKKIFTGRNKAILFLDNELSRDYNGKLFYNEEGVAVPPDETKNDDLPTFRDEGDYRFFMYRQISATIVGENSWKATDFSKGNVLKKSTQMLHKRPAYREHWAYVGNAIGQVLNPTWQNAYTNSAGQEIPAGIDAEFAMNKEMPSLQELIMHMSSAYNPYDAASVGVVFEWEASHKFESMWDFYDNIGTEIEDEDGKVTMVRRIATKILEYQESSLVSFGADFFARQKDGKNEVKYSREDVMGGISLKQEDPFFKSEFDEKGKYYVFSSALNYSKLESKDKELNSDRDKKTTPMKTEKLIGFALTLLGASSVEDLDEANIPQEVAEGVTYAKLLEESNKVTSLEADVATSKTSLATLKSEKEALDTKVVTLTKSLTTEQQKNEQLTETIEANKAKVVYADKYREDLVEKAKALYTAKNEGDVSDVLLAEFETNDIPTLEEKVKLFGGDIGFSGSCAKCGSKDFKFRSSREDGKEGDDVIETKEAEDEPMWKRHIN